MPASASSLAVPPVEMISTPSSLSPRAKSTTPRLSKTDTSARSTLSSPCSPGTWRVAELLPSDMGLQHALVDQHEPRVALVQPDSAAGDQPDRAREQFVLCLMQDRQDFLLAASVGKRYSLLQDDRTGVDSVVHEV